RGAAVLHVLLRLITREVYARRLELPTPMREVRALRTLALLDLESHPPGAGIDRVTIVIDPTPGRVVQHTLFTRVHPTPEQLSTLAARLGALRGSIRTPRLPISAVRIPNPDSRIPIGIRAAPLPSAGARTRHGRRRAAGAGDHRSPRLCRRNRAAVG